MTSSANRDVRLGRVRRLWRGPVVGLTVLLLAGGVGALLWNNARDPSQELRQARRAFRAGRFAEAERLADGLLSDEARSAPAALLAGRSAAKGGHVARALRDWDRVPDDGSAEAVAARVESGDLLLRERKQLSAAERAFRRAIAMNPAEETANDRLGFLLGLAARNWDAIPFRLRLIDLNRFGPVHLYLLCRGDSVLENADQLQVFHRAAPDDPLPLLGLARQAIDGQRVLRAEQLLRTAVALRPTLAEAQVKLGRLLLESGQEQAWLRWYAELLHEARAHPGLWVILGRWAEQHSQPRSAIRCFWEAVRIDPNNEQANYQLSQRLIAEGNSAAAAPFLQRSQLLAGYADAVRIAWQGQDLSAAHRAAKLAESLGLMWEAYGWYRLATTHVVHPAWAAEGVSRLRSRLDGLPMVRAVPEFNPALKVDFSRYPLPVIPRAGEKLPTNPEPSDSARPRLRFVDRAAETGIVFRYFDGADRAHQTHRMYEFGGGGAGVLDYDLDGQPDIYLTQGCRWPPRRGQRAYLDRLYRNDSGRFQDVTAETGLTEEGFSAGLTVGDFNSDGFPDLYVANIGSNRFYQNNGDGTFSEITHATATGGNEWSTSCLLADLNGDALPDLYVVNYLTGPDLFTRLCPDANGRPRSCSPRHFAAAADQLYINRGDGRFQNVTGPSGISIPNGKGLGIVAADLSGSGRLNLFIANDASPNFYFVNQTDQPGTVPTFREQALPLGLAMNEGGRPEACMGVAAGDADGDGLPDLFVTNFYNESNTLFRQQASGLFVDATREAGLYDPSLKMLGFGTQFLDGDLDGHLDLIVTNGHIDDLRDTGLPWRMPGQYFRNLGTGRFVEVSRKQLGRYFSGKHLGRGLARLDWNGDGREDIVISHLDSPVALLTNVTPAAGHFLTVELRGVQSNRDAIGTTVTALVGGHSLYRQMTAGDGFQCSNERRLTFGLGHRRHVERLTIRWPSGLVQTFADLPSDTHIRCVEGRGTLTLRRTARSQR